MSVILWIIGGFGVYMAIGTTIMASIDRDGRLLAWVDAAPSQWLSMIAVIAWPVVLAFYLRSWLRERR